MNSNCFVAGLLMAAGTAAFGGVAVDEIEDEAQARAAVKAVTDVAALSDIAFNSTKWRLRADAVYFLADQEAVKKILREDADWHVRVAAVRKIVETAELIPVAKGDKDERVRAAAAMRIPDAAVREKIVAEDASAKVREMVRRVSPAAVRQTGTAVPVPYAKETPIESVTVKF